MNGNKIIMKNIVQEKSFAFALDVIKVYKEMLKQNEYIISKQLVRSATSIGANVEEAQAAQTKKDFAAKMSIASKEARETKYWLRLMMESKLIVFDFSDLLRQCNDLINLLTSIVKTSQTRTGI